MCNNTQKNSEITLPRLLAARDKVAHIIARRGEEGKVFLPIFQRLDREVEAMIAREIALEKALKIGTRNVTLNEPQKGHHSIII